MSLIRLIAVECEWCHRRITANTSDTLEAERLALRRKWLEHEWGYGNRSHYCCEDCKIASLEFCVDD